MFLIKLLKYSFIAVYVIVVSVIVVGILIYIFYEEINISIALFCNFTDETSRIISNALYNDILDLVDLQNIVVEPLNGFDVTDEEYLNLLLTDSIVEITSAIVNGMPVYAIKVDGVLYTVDEDLFLFLIYIL